MIAAEVIDPLLVQLGAQSATPPPVAERRRLWGWDIHLWAGPLGALVVGLAFIVAGVLI